MAKKQTMCILPRLKKDMHGFFIILRCIKPMGNMLFFGHHIVSCKVRDLVITVYKSSKIAKYYESEIKQASGCNLYCF